MIEPEVDLPGRLGDGRLVADDLLSVAGIDLDLTSGQRVLLSREEVAAIAEEGSASKRCSPPGSPCRCPRRPTSPTPHHLPAERARRGDPPLPLFLRLLSEIQPRAVNPFERGALGFVKHRVVRDVILGRPALMCVLVLAGEEVPT
ncbi:MAG: hypothetical protein KY431_03275 [Actinobacteria bacterium]|nr:hypothetical protein [Actinomycetota bacterium]